MDFFSFAKALIKPQRSFRFLTFIFLIFSLQPAAVDDLRKWTSNEAIGDITVTPDCMTRVSLGGSQNATNTSIVNDSTLQQSGEDCTDDIVVISSNSSNVNSSTQQNAIDHRLPSPEEQCQILALK